MSRLQTSNAKDQVVEHLKQELLRGTWVGEMPGEGRLMARLGVGRNTIRRALETLDEEGWLHTPGAGCRRKITLPKSRPSQSLNVGILLYDDADRDLPRTNLLRQRLLDAGHTPAIASRTLEQLGKNPNKVRQFVQKNAFDAWIVYSATSEILEWFTTQETPVFSMYGSFLDIPIAGVSTRKLPLVMDLVQELADMGHRRIVNITRKERITPKLGRFEETFMAKLEECGLSASEYNLPVWGPGTDGLHQCLEKLFAHTPPSAIYISEFQIFNATLNHLASRNILAPRDVSLICGESNYSFRWLETEPCHFDWDQNRIVQRATQWVSNIAKGKKDLRQTMVNAKLLRGETMGPPKMAS